MYEKKHSVPKVGMAAATVAKRGSKEAHTANMSEPVSFHLAFLVGNNYVLPDGKNSVDVLRMPFLSSVRNEECPETALNSRSKFISYFDGNLFSSKTSNLTGTKMEFWAKKYTSTQSASDDVEKAWQDRLLIVTDKRIFIITMKKTVDHKELTGQSSRSASDDQTKRALSRISSQVDLEIVDSIPVEEITSIRLETKPGVWDADSDSEPSSCLRSAASLLPRVRARDSGDPVPPPSPSNSLFAAEQQASDRSLRRGEQQPSERGLRRAFTFRQPSTGAISLPASRGQPVPVTLDGHCEPILRIATKPGGFNRGQPYYFLLRQQDHHCLEATAAAAAGDGVAARRPLRDRADAEALAARLDALAARRRGEHARETRFLRLQV
jgi:hypothetical protein